MPILGKCRLCLQEGVYLQESHYLPKGIYRMLRIDRGKGQNPNPMQITLRGVSQTSKQVWAHLLCASCEARFAAKGEDWIFRNGLKKNGTFKLVSALASSPFMMDASSTARIYRASSIPMINVDALTYFAASMFWRGSAHPWKLDGTVPVPLGPYAEPLRQYLMGVSEFPSDMTLTVTVRVPSSVSHLTFGPVGEWRGLHLVAKFPMPGIAFSISAGMEIPAAFRQMCFVRGDGNPIFVSEAIETHIREEGVRMLRLLQQRAS